MIEMVIKMRITDTYIALINPLLIVILLVLIYIGYKKGLLLQLFSFLSLIVKIAVAWMFAPILARVLMFFEPDLGLLENSALDQLITHNINTAIWFIVLYLGLTLLFLFLRPVIKGAGKLPILKPINQLAGMLFGAIKFYVYMIVAIFLLQTPLVNNGHEVIVQTWLDNINRSAPIVFERLSEWAASTPAISNLLAGEILSDEDVEAIEQWLISQEIDAATIQDILERLPKNDE